MSGPEGDVTPQQLQQHLGEVQLLDVREPWEWQAGHVEGATHVPMGQLGPALHLVADDRTVVCVCRSGNRSGSVAAALREHGKDAVNMLGGMQAWAAADLPFVSETDEPPTVV